MSCAEFSWQNKKGQKIYAQDWRPIEESRGVVALVHGLGEHIGRYQHVAQLLNKAGYALVGFDLPGHGRSDGARGHAAYDEIVEDIDHLLSEAGERYPGKPRFIYGHSLGGALVLYYTLKRRPDLKGVIVSAPGIQPGAKVPGSQLLLAKIMARLNPSFATPNGLDLNNLSRDADIIRAYQNDPLVHPKISARLGLDLVTKGEWVLAHAAEFPLPLLLFRGSEDRLVSKEAIEAFAKAVPAEKLTYKVWEGLYHENHNEPEKLEVIHYMVDWLDQHK